MDRYFLLHSETVIDSAHRLENYKGKCANVHGHSWKVEVWIKGHVHEADGKTGILFDFGNIKQIKDKYDHKLLNAVSPFDKINPTAENMSYIFFCQLKEINPKLHYKVRVYETYVEKKCWCEYGDIDEIR